MVAYTQASSALKENWLQCIKNGIKNNLKEVGKGWYEKSPHHLHLILLNCSLRFIFQLVFFLFVLFVLFFFCFFCFFCFVLRVSF